MRSTRARGSRIQSRARNRAHGIVRTESRAHAIARTKLRGAMRFTSKKWKFKKCTGQQLTPRLLLHSTVIPFRSQTHPIPRFIHSTAISVGGVCSFLGDPQRDLGCAPVELLLTERKKNTFFAWFGGHCPPLQRRFRPDFCVNQLPTPLDEFATTF